MELATLDTHTEIRLARDAPPPTERRHQTSPSAVMSQLWLKYFMEKLRKNSDCSRQKLRKTHARYLPPCQLTETAGDNILTTMNNDMI